MKVSWTDSEKGRQFWVWCIVDEEWVKDAFVTWEDLKKVTFFGLTIPKSVIP